MWLIAGLLFLGGLAAAYQQYPPFGGRAKKAWKSKNYNGKIFVNQTPTSMAMGARASTSLARDMLRRDHNRKPVKIARPAPLHIQEFLSSAKPQVMWLGHSTILMNIAGTIILTDPILSNRASPFPFAGPKRSISELPMSAKDLPDIDAVLISHDHYDHLDYATIRAIRHKTKRFFVPLGVAAHLEKWGVPSRKITELDWWEESQFEGITFACTPSRHFSGRKLNDRFKTLWCSWVIKSPVASVFFSGDTGYGSHFKAIGKKYGAFDLTLMECGQYNEHWAHIHMTPEQTVAAHHDIKGRLLLPIHWGAFVLALHDWDESVTRAHLAGTSLKTNIATPQIGELMDINAKKYPQKQWWQTA